MTSTYQNQTAVGEWDALISETFMSVMRNVYLWMCLGLFVTGSVSIVLIYTPLFSILVQILQVPFLFIGILIGEIILVGWLSARIGKLSVRASRIGFIAYAILNGITMSVIFLAYTESSIALTFVTTACVFGAMGIIGYTTKIDLSKWGSYLLMGLIGFLIGSVINLFFAYSVLELLLTYAGIALFVGLTVYDTQRIKKMVIEASQSNDEMIVQRVGLLGALRLYLDFINLFLLILRLFGRGRKR
jgi:FtsH-binding integral membrane protein